MFDLFFLDYFVPFSVGFRLSVHLELTSKSGGQKLLKDLCDKYSVGQMCTSEIISVRASIATVIVEGDYASFLNHFTVARWPLETFFLNWYSVIRRTL